MTSCALIFFAMPGNAQGNGLPHPPIQINGDAGFLLPGSGITGGLGTEESPFIIEGWDITHPPDPLVLLGYDDVPAINITDTTFHVLIRNVHAWEAKAPLVVLDNAQNVTISGDQTADRPLIHASESAGIALTGIEEINHVDLHFPGVRIEWSPDATLRDIALINTRFQIDIFDSPRTVIENVSILDSWSRNTLTVAGASPGTEIQSLEVKCLPEVSCDPLTIVSDGVSVDDADLETTSTGNALVAVGNDIVLTSVVVQATQTIGLDVGGNVSMVDSIVNGNVPAVRVRDGGSLLLENTTVIGPERGIAAYEVDNIELRDSTIMAFTCISIDAESLQLDSSRLDCVDAVIASRVGTLRVTDSEVQGVNNGLRWIQGGSGQVDGSTIGGGLAMSFSQVDGPVSIRDSSIRSLSDNRIVSPHVTIAHTTFAPPLHAEAGGGLNVAGGETVTITGTSFQSSEVRALQISDFGFATLFDIDVAGASTGVVATRGSGIDIEGVSIRTESFGFGISSVPQVSLSDVSVEGAGLIPGAIIGSFDDLRLTDFHVDNATFPILDLADADGTVHLERVTATGNPPCHIFRGLNATIQYDAASAPVAESLCRAYHELPDPTDDEPGAPAGDEESPLPWGLMVVAASGAALWKRRLADL